MSTASGSRAMTGREPQSTSTTEQRVNDSRSTQSTILVCSYLGDEQQEVEVNQTRLFVCSATTGILTPRTINYARRAVSYRGMSIVYSRAWAKGCPGRIPHPIAFTDSTCSWRSGRSILLYLDSSTERSSMLAVKRKWRLYIKIRFLYN